MVSGETNIDLPKHNPNLHIDKLILDPPARANPKALSAIEASDYIIISPGDLFTSTLPNFLVDDVAEAVSSAKAIRIYVCNLMTKHGETTGFAAQDHVRTIHQYLGRACIDVVLINSAEPSLSQAEEYARESSFPVKYSAASLLDEGVSRVIESALMSAHSLIRHDTNKVAWELFKLIPYILGNHDFVGLIHNLAYLL